MSWTADDSQVVVGGENSRGKWEENKDPVRFMSFFFRGCKLAASRRGSHPGPPGDRPIYFFQAPPLCIPHLASSAPLHSYIFQRLYPPATRRTIVRDNRATARTRAFVAPRTHARHFVAARAPRTHSARIWRMNDSISAAIPHAFLATYAA